MCLLKLVTYVLAKGMVLLMKDKCVISDIPMGQNQFDLCQKAMRKVGWRRQNR
jgi:hypothetical protein